MGSVLYGVLDKSYPVMVKGEGIYLYDRDGNKYIDASGGAVCVGIGHGVKEVVDAVISQVERISFVYGGQFTNEPRELLADEIIDHLDHRFSKVFFVSGGSEATEAALKIARQYHLETGHPEKYIVISRWGSYHGNTIGALSMSGRTSWREPYTPYLLNFPHIHPPYCYRCPYELEYPRCNVKCARELEIAITHTGPEYVSAFIAEPITGGSIPAMAPPPEYYPMVREICDKYNVLFIADEVLCGFGRTGKVLAIDHWNVLPDLVATGKGFSSGYVAIGGVILTEKIYAGFQNGSRTVRHSHTFAGIPASCAVALAVQRYMRANNLVARSAELGEYLFTRAKRLEKFEIVGEVAGGRGLLLGIEFVKDKTTKEPFPKQLGLDAWVVREVLKEHVSILPGSGGCVDGVNGDRIEVAPPFVITREEIDIVVNTLETVIDRVQGEIRKEGYLKE
jgi:adenosylmethionine-8-amino-7-oxononanoate aminotransferase